MVETVFKTIKNELIWGTSFQTRTPPSWRLADTSMASTIPAGDIPLWETNRQHH